MAKATAVLDEQLRVRIKAIICDVLKTDPECVTLSSRFVEDHGADSLQYIDVLTSIERECGVLIDPEEMSRMTTLAGIYAVIEQAL